MKLFKKLMAGAMAIAMLSVYTVAFATQTVSGGSADSTVSGSATGKGGYAGASDPVFTMTLPTQAAASASLAFMVDPQQIVANSPPSGAGAGSVYGTVIFTTTSGATTSYNVTSAPLKVTSKSSVDVTVNMLATLSDTKMKLSTTSGFDTVSGGVDDSKSHLYLAVNVTTTNSGGTPVTETENVTALGAKKDTVLKAVPGNFTTTISGSTVISTVSGTPADTSWKSVEYTVTGTANAAADWQIDDIEAPDLTIKWVVDPSTKVTTALDDPAAAADYTAALDKAAYATNELVTVFVKPTDASKKLKTVTFNYSAINSKDPTVADAGKTVKAEVNATPVNGAYKATFAMPAMAKSDATGYQAPSFTITVG